MAKLTIILVFAFLYSVPYSQAKCSRNYHFDYLLLATQWPETFCEHNHCVRHQDRWLIHGAWPENNDGSWPQNCCTDHPYNHDVIKPILQDLKDNWKTLKADGNNDQFWSHEYTKHGTCAIECPLMKDEFQYFKSTLDAFKKLNIEKWLANVGIVPSESKRYSLKQFHQAIQNGLGHKVQLQCVHNKQHNVPVISQINFCLKKQDLAPFDCPLKDHGCTGSEIGYFPTHK